MDLLVFGMIIDNGYILFIMIMDWLIVLLLQKKEEVEDIREPLVLEVMK